MRNFHINEHRVDDIWEDREHQQQIIQSTIFTEILPISRLVSSTPSENFNQIGRETLYTESTTPLNIEIKKRSSKSWSKSVHISYPISINNSNAVVSIFNETEKINCEDLGALYEKEARRDEKNKANMTRLLATT
ncbi:11636_t:CDS:1 [Acaulospora morrowiae]|uniref:11636_t:CDS:1 n=1 Tax=Acaulospora morrowiae TaxID=94023 RepID=A0A9N9BT36_9GLOM|nr:11636_t:CDS:1 [Acaulospora morrowiae]